MAGGTPAAPKSLTTLSSPFGKAEAALRGRRVAHSKHSSLQLSNLERWVDEYFPDAIGLEHERAVKEGGGEEHE